MTDRRRPKVQIGRRRTDVPVKILEAFKEEMKTHVAETIRATVNGKIDNLTHTMLKTSDFDRYVDEDSAWKKANEPALDNMKNLTGLGKFGLSAIVTVGAVLAGLSAIKSYFK